MSFKYINPGFAKLLDDNVDSHQVESSEYSKSGFGFWQSDNTKGVTVANFPENDEFWAKFDFYLPNSTDVNIYLYAPGDRNNGIYLRISNYYSCVYVYAQYQGSNYDIAYVGKKPTAANAADIKGTTGLILDAINSVWMNLKWGTGGYIDVQINNKKLTRWQKYAPSYGTDKTPLVKISSNTAAAPISNVIFSDSEISPKEQIVLIPTSLTETDMTETDGIYSANAAGQTILQTLDVSSLVETYGGDSQVTGLLLTGYPAYKSGEELSSLTAISKSNGTVTEYGTHTLSDEVTGAVGDVQAMNTTISNLSGLKFGWKVGT